MSAFLQKFKTDRQTAVFILTVGLLAVAGIWLLAYSTPFGLGLNDDSIAYIAGARSILAGNGYREAWLVSNGPVTHFPPGFPAVLAAIGFLTGLDPLRGARALNGLLFGLNIALAGGLAWRMTRSRVAGLLVSALILLNSSLLYIHSRAMSEPLYIFLTLVSFLLLDRFFERPKNSLLFILGMVLGWAFLARYAGLSLLAAVIATLLILPGLWRERLKYAALLGAGALPWIIGWLLRNQIVGGSVTNRVLDWHPITSENWRQAKGTFADFFIPALDLQKAIGSNVFIFIFIIAGLALILWTLIKGLPRLFRPGSHPRPETLPFVNSLYILVYLLVLFTTMTLFDPATKFQVRILSPTYISLLALMAALGIWLWRKPDIVWKAAIMLLALGFVGMLAYSQVAFVGDARQGGNAFASEKWFDSEVIPFLEEIPPEVIILSNEPGVIYLYAGRSSGVLPETEPGISMVQEAVLDGRAVLVLFRVNKADPETLRYYYALGDGLYLFDFSHTWIFTAIPEEFFK